MEHLVYYIHYPSGTLSQRIKATVYSVWLRFVACLYSAVKLEYSCKFLLKKSSNFTKQMFKNHTSGPKVHKKL